MPPGTQMEVVAEDSYGIQEEIGIPMDHDDHDDVSIYTERERDR